MKYQVWDSASYSHMEPLTPFSKLHESDSLNDIRDYLDCFDEEKLLFVTMENGKILFKTSDVIYESPDGKIIYERNKISHKRKRIK
jgi:hypothetical protein